jgi:hypothetical protein
VQVWEPEADKPALQLLWSPFGILTCLFYLAATVYYFYVRFRYTMALGITSWCVACLRAEDTPGVRLAAYGSVRSMSRPGRPATNHLF